MFRALLYSLVNCVSSPDCFHASWVQEHDILRENGLIGRPAQMFMFKTIRIPNQAEGAVAQDNPLVLTEEQKRIRVVDMFVREVKCPREEARYYLDCRGYVFADALRDWRRDKQWEERQFASSAGGGSRR